MALTQANDILNGYFYTFIYKAKDGSLDVDETPVIYCVGPAPGRDNNIIGLNFHNSQSSSEKLWSLECTRERESWTLTVGLYSQRWS